MAEHLVGLRSLQSVVVAVREGVLPCVSNNCSRRVCLLGVRMGPVCVYLLLFNQRLGFNLNQLYLGLNYVFLNRKLFVVLIEWPDNFQLEPRGQKACPVRQIEALLL